MTAPVTITGAAIKTNPTVRVPVAAITFIPVIKVTWPAPCPQNSRLFIGTVLLSNEMKWSCCSPDDRRIRKRRIRRIRFKFGAKSKLFTEMVYGTALEDPLPRNSNKLPSMDWQRLEGSSWWKTVPWTWSWAWMSWISSWIRAPCQSRMWMEKWLSSSVNRRKL